MPFLLIPFGSAFLYAVAAIMLKRSSSAGVGPWRTTFVSNVTIGLLYSLLYLVKRPIQPEASWLQPLACGILFFGGQVFTFAAISKGDISVATPLMGAKVILVTIFAALLIDKPMPSTWWSAAFLGTLGVALLGYDRPEHRTKTLFTACYAVAASACYALTDVLAQKWAPLWGGTPLIPRTFTIVAILSFGLLLFARGKVTSIPREARPWLLFGSVIIAIQALGVAFTLTNYGAAPAVNVVYGTRGLWSLILVALLAHRLGLPERHTPKPILAARVAGCLLLLVAVVVVMGGPTQ